MSHTRPTLLLVVRDIHDKMKIAVSREDIADSTGLSSEEVGKILDLLLEKGTLRRFDGVLYTIRTFEQIAPGLISIYTGMKSEESLEFAMRGALMIYSPLREDMLKRAMRDLGFSEKEVDDLIVRDLTMKYLKKVRAIHIGKIRNGSRLVPVGFYAELDADVHAVMEKLLEYYRRLGFVEEIFEEELLIGRYPPEMAQPARESIKKERIEVRNRLRISSPPILSSPGFLSFTYSSKGLHRDLLLPL